MRFKEFISEGYTLRATDREKWTDPGSDEDYIPDVRGKDTKYEIVNNKTGKVVGVAQWSSNDYMGGNSSMEVKMHNGATRHVNIPFGKDPQTAFNWFVKQTRTSKKYKEAIGEMTTAGAVSAVSMPMGTIQKRKKVGEDDILQTGSNLGGSKDSKFAVVDTKVGGWKRTYPDRESAEAWAAAWNKEYGHKEKVKVIALREGTAITDDYLEVRFNNENAYETAYRLFGDVWEEPNSEQIFIHDKHLGKLEDALFSRGFEEGEDYEIEAVDVHNIDYSLYDPEYDDGFGDDYEMESSKTNSGKEYKKLPYDEFVKGAKLKEPRTPRGKGKRQPKLGI